MTDDLREKMGQAPSPRVRPSSTRVGTVEFLVDADRNFYFMEMNTRIQVEHTITEEVVDYDLIKEQIKLAHGDPISGRNYYPKMHAIQCRINAEDPTATSRRARNGHRLPRTGWTRHPDRHPRLRRVPHSAALRQHGRQAHRGCADPG